MNSVQYEWSPNPQPIRSSEFDTMLAEDVGGLTKSSNGDTSQPDGGPIRAADDGRVPVDSLDLEGESGLVIHPSSLRGNADGVPARRHAGAPTSDL